MALPRVVEFSPPVDTAYIADTNPHVGNWDTIVVLAAGVGSLTDANADLSHGATNAVTLPVGTTLRGTYTNIQLTSGKILAMKTVRNPINPFMA